MFSDNSLDVGQAGNEQTCCNVRPLQQFRKRASCANLPGTIEIEMEPHERRVSSPVEQTHCLLATRLLPLVQHLDFLNVDRAPVGRSFHLDVVSLVLGENLRICNGPDLIVAIGYQHELCALGDMFLI